MELSIEEQYQVVLKGEGTLLLSQNELMDLTEYITGVKLQRAVIDYEKREIDCGILIQLVDYMKGRK